jgi:hypothetical protein
MTDRRSQRPRRDAVKIAVIVAMALATVAAADSASARHRQQVSIGKAPTTTAKKVLPLKTGGPGSTVQAPTSKGIIMRDGGVCDPIRHMGC